MSPASIIDPQSEIQKRPRGAPKGNNNALKHGFYTSKFATSELKSLPADFKGLTDEITMLRLMIRRQVDLLNAAPTFQDFNQTLRLLCIACLTLNRLLRTHLLLSSNGNDEFSLALTAALEQIGKDWHLDDPEYYPSHPDEHPDLPFTAPRVHPTPAPEN